MKGGKVYPTPAVTSSVDQLTSQIDRDIQLITSSLDRTANSYGNSKNSGGDRNRNDSNNVRLYTAPGSEDSRNDYNYGQTNSSATAANGYNGTGNNGRTVSNEDDEEEVKLSHQLAKKDNIVTKELEENFTKILQQLNEYKKRYNNAVVANKRIEEKLIANNEKIELLADENSKLKQDSLIMKPNAINRNNLDRTNGIGNKKDELYYRSEQIRKALLSDENEDETAITFDSLLKTYGVKDAIIHYLSVFAPFRRDIRTVQARFGTGVASYFIFYRFL